MDLFEHLGAHVVSLESHSQVEECIEGDDPCHVLVIGRGVDPKLEWLAELRKKYDEHRLPIIFADDDDENPLDATRVGANASFDRSIHRDFGLMEKLVSALAYE